MNILTETTATRTHSRIVTEYTECIVQKIEESNLIPYFVTVAFHPNPPPDSDDLRQLRHDYRQIDRDLKRPDTDRPLSETITLTTHANQRWNRYREKLRFSALATNSKRTTPNDLTPKAIERLWRQHAEFMTHLVAHLVKNHNRPSKHDMHPITVEFIDLNGSKHRQANFSEPDDQHTHGIYLIHPDTKAKFQRLIDTRFRDLLYHPALMPIQNIDVSMIEPTSSSIRKLVSYSSKLLEGENAIRINNNTPLTQFYPIARSERMGVDSVIYEDRIS